MKNYSLAVIALISLVFAGIIRADDQTPLQQRTFSSPADATNALLQAAKAYDRDAIHQMFGPEVTNLMTGDKTLDERHFESFAKALDEHCNTVKDDNGNITLEIGTNQWAFPIPLIQTNGSWMFDTLAGEDEIINRHIGRDEFYAIGVCRAYVKAQRDYAARSSGSSGTPEYARRFKSKSGEADGLYSTSATNIPFSSFVAEAAWEGYGWTSSKRPKPFHGYFFKILTRQGPDAPGGRMDYIHDGKMTGGFALIAYPVRWGESGIMTFIVGQDGIVHQRSLGEKSVKIASKIKDFNPDKDWTVVEEPGITDFTAEDSASSSR